MRLLVSVLLIAAFSFIAGLYWPWWCVAPVAFLVTLLIPQSIIRGFLSGFAGVFLLWVVLTVWIDTKNESILSGKIANLFPLGGSTIILILVTALIGGLVGGFAGMSGASLRSIFRPVQSA